MAVAHKISNLTFALHPESSSIIRPHHEVKLLVFLETTSRQSTVIHIAFGDGNSRELSLEDLPIHRDSNTIEASNQDMFVVSDYEKSCNLSLEVDYSYSSQGRYNPHVWAANAQTNVSMALPVHINVLLELQGIRIRASALTAPVLQETTFSVHFLVSSPNTTLHWSIHNQDGSLVTNISSTSATFQWTFLDEGYHTVTVRASNFISEISASVSINVQYKVVGLELSCNHWNVSTGGF